jgi:hypothetical protein
MARRLDVITSPRQFFEAGSDDPSLAGPALVVLGHAFAGLGLLLSLVPVLAAVFEDASTEALAYTVGTQTVSAPRELVMATVLPFVVLVILWALTAGFTYVVSKRYDGTGSFRRLLMFMGWGFLPPLIPTLVEALVVAGLFASAPDLATEEAIREWVEANVIRAPSVRLIGLVTPLFTLWGTYLWLIAAEYGRDLSRRHALISISLPAAVALANEAQVYVTLLI